MSNGGQTLYDKLWTSHVVADEGDGVALLYIDRHLLHEVSTPQAFETLNVERRGVRRPGAHLAVADHAVPTRNQAGPIEDPAARSQVALLARNADKFGIRHFGLDDPRHGIVHVVGPEQGFTQPGMTLVCGDSHTSTHGAFGALAFGIGASECGVVLATQTLRQTRARTMRVRVSGALQRGVAAKDLALAIVARLGAGGGAGYAIEYAGRVVRALSMEGRMTLCNMTIEAGARVGLIGPDKRTFAYLSGRRLSPKGIEWDAAVTHWRSLATDGDAVFDRELRIDAGAVAPWVTWGTSPDQSLPIDKHIPDPASLAPEAAERAERALAYLGLTPGRRLDEIVIDHAFIGSCTNGRIEDLRAAAAIVRGGRVAAGVTALVVPGSGLVKLQAEAEGLDRVFLDAGFQWRQAGCSMCVAMNDDRVPAGARCVSTSNRNFEGRQGPGARTHLASPATVAASALTGLITDPRRFA
jgi:3-isopropylmalate/(R)-2-methylmalate dehydratase large subunit